LAGRLLPADPGNRLCIKASRSAPSNRSTNSYIRLTNCNPRPADRDLRAADCDAHPTDRHAAAADCDAHPTNRHA
jgi:hypothetical protein